MKALIVIPKNDGYHPEISNALQSRIFPPAGLARMAGILGKHAKVNVLDERLQAFTHEDTANLVIVYFNSYNHYRALALCAHYKKLGCFVVITGLTSAALSDYTVLNSNCVFMGSGENCITEFLEDLFEDKVKRIYNSSDNRDKFTPSPLSLAS